MIPSLAALELYLGTAEDRCADSGLRAWDSRSNLFSQLGDPIPRELELAVPLVPAGTKFADGAKVLVRIRVPQIRNLYLMLIRSEPIGGAASLAAPAASRMSFEIRRGLEDASEPNIPAPLIAVTPPTLNSCGYVLDLRNMPLCKEIAMAGCVIDDPQAPRTAMRTWWRFFCDRLPGGQAEIAVLGTFTVVGP